MKTKPIVVGNYQLCIDEELYDKFDDSLEVAIVTSKLLGYEVSYFAVAGKINITFRYDKNKKLLLELFVDWRNDGLIHEIRTLTNLKKKDKYVFGIEAIITLSKKL